ncbi:transglycosylase [Acinetobacter pittii]|uniref:Lytic transglycosylase domain-containing protein n=1 Tax=Acinetobacter pittii TaxID=48296 RepID=A0AAE9MAS2_ACIPI|nr:lytic transglycosylase domain-containing protein [Acinetobacter pittii]AZP28428.1 transglycosylase [Acinetobacter pittii]USU95563.1 lytic transglycosylase domain-containing protein [Acinetobacter pittii]
MGLAYNALDDDDADLDAYDLSQTLNPSLQSGVKTDPKKLKESPSFFSGSSTAVQRGVKAGLGKVAVSLIGSEEDNRKAAEDDPLQRQLYEISIQKDGVLKTGSFEQFTERKYKEGKSSTMQFVKDNSPNEGDGMGAQIINSLGDYATRGAIGGGVAGGAYVVGTSTKDYVYNKLIEAGVDESTAQKASWNDGFVDGLGMGVPVYRGAGILKNAGLVAAPVALTETGHAINENILESKGYTKQAKEYEFSTENVITGLILGGAINRGTAYLDSRGSKKPLEQTPEEAQTTAEIKDDIIPIIVKRLDDEYTELGLHSDDIETREKIKQNRNVAENQIMSRQPINVPHSDISEPTVKPKLNKSLLNSNGQLLATKAEQLGINPSDALTIAHLESGAAFSASAQNKKSSANGILQVIDSSWERLGGGNRNDPDEQIRVGLLHMKEANSYIAKKLGREPVAHEQYLGHLLGPGGAVKVLEADPNRPLIDVVRQYDAKNANAIVNNNRMSGLTVGQAISKWEKKWNSVSARYGGVGSERVSTAYDANGNSYELLTEVEDLSNLIVSNQINGALNSMYPQELQPRDRSSAASQVQIDSIANNLRSELLGNSHRISDGAPITGLDNIVESGNGRALAISKAYETGKADNYRAFVEKFAQDNGIDISGIKQPVLTRKRLSDTDRVEFARSANQSDVAGYSATERARNDILPDTSLLKFNQDGNINYDQSNDFVKQFIQGVPEAERVNLVTRDNQLSQDGKRRIESALTHYAYGDSNLVARLSENIDDGSKNVLNALLRNAAQLAQLNDLVKQGGRHDNTIAKDLAQAAQKLNDLTTSGGKVEDYLKQGQLIDDGLSEGAKHFLGVFETNKRSAKAISDSIQSEIDRIESMGDPRQGSLFGDTPEQIIAMQILRDNPDMDIATFIEDSVGNELSATTKASNVLEQVKKEAELADMDILATQTALNCALQFG